MISFLRERERGSLEDFARNMGGDTPREWKAMNELRLLMFTMSNEYPRFGVDFVLYLVDFAVFFFFAHRLFHKKKYSFIAVNVCALAGALVFALAGVLIEAFYQLLGAAYNCGLLLFTVLALHFLYKDKLFYKTAYSLLMSFIFTVSDIFLMNLFLSIDIGRSAYMYGDDRNGTFCVLYCVTLRLIRLVAAAVMYRMLRRFSVVGYKHNWAMLNYAAVILFCGAQLLGIFTVNSYSGTYAVLFPIRAAVGIALLIGLMPLLRFFPKICRLFQTDELGADMSFEAAVPNTDGLSAREMQKLRHDVKNNVATISALIDSGDGEEAKRLLGELSARLGKALGGGNKTNVPAIDTAVSEKSKRCEELGITLDMHIEPLPEPKIPPIDLSSVISNILDNAIEAAQQCDEPIIAFRIFKYKSYLAVICENPTNSIPRVVNGSLVTTKDGGGHGYGVEIINEICKNNNGRFQFEFDNKIFKASAFLEL